MLQDWCQSFEKWITIQIQAFPPTTLCVLFINLSGFSTEPSKLLNNCPPKDHSLAHCSENLKPTAYSVGWTELTQETWSTSLGLSYLSTRVKFHLSSQWALSTAAPHSTTASILFSTQALQRGETLFMKPSLSRPPIHWPPFQHCQSQLQKIQKRDFHKRKNLGVICLRSFSSAGPKSPSCP